MMKKVKYICTLSLIILGILMSGQKAFAQDAGKPAVRSIAFYTLGGGAGGAVIGIAYWMLDPLAPSADLRGSVLQGYGVGVFLGFIFGITQLNKQAVFPYSEPEMLDEFDGNVQNNTIKKDPFVYAETAPKRRSLEIPLFQFQYKF